MKRIRILNRLAALGIALALLITLAIGWAVRYAFGEATRTADWVVHTLEVQRSLEGIETDLRAAQSMARGHALFGDGEALRLYRDSMQRLRQRIAEVRGLTSDNPAQKRALGELADTLAAYSRHLESLFQISQERGPDAARRYFFGGAGHPLLIEAIARIDAMIADEDRLLAERRAALDRSNAFTERMIILARALVLAILVATVIALRREIQRRMAAEKETRVLNASLEKQVAARTAELKQWETIFRKSGWGVVVVDQQTFRITATNPAMVAMLRATRPLAGRPLAELFPPEARALLLERARLIGEQGYLNYESVWLRDDGTTFPVDIQVTVYRDEDGRLWRVGNVQDITERKRTEAALREREEQLRLFVEYAPAPIAMFDRDMRYLAWSRRWMADYALGERDLGGISHYEVFSEIPQRWRDIHRRCLAGASEFSDADPFVRQDGSTQWLKWAIFPWYGADGAIGGIAIFSEDITERKESQDAVRDFAQQLGELSRRLLQVQEEERRAIARELHDEVGQALTAIKLILSALRHRQSGEAEIALLDDGIGMVDVAIAQIRDRSLELRPPMLDDIGLAGTLEWLTGRLAAKVSLRITADIAPLAERPAPEVESAAFRIAQEALTNVLRHAEARQAELRLRQEDGWLCLSVKDDGAGFDPRSKEAGFGLSGMRERALLLGGEFMLDSSPGKGTMIRARLPVLPNRSP